MEYIQVELDKLKVGGVGQNEPDWSMQSWIEGTRMEYMELERRDQNEEKWIGEGRKWIADHLGYSWWEATRPFILLR